MSLVQAVLDERIAGERADRVEAGHRGLEGRRQRRIGLARRRGEGDARLLDEGARRGRAEPGDHPVAAQARLAVAGFHHHVPGLEPGGHRLGEHRKAAGLARRHQRLDVGVRGPGEVRRAVEDGHPVALRRVGGKAERVLDPGVSRADDDDVLIEEGAGIIERVLDRRASLRTDARDAQEVGIALRPDGKDDMGSLDPAAVAQGQGEGPARTRDGRHLGVEAHGHAGRLGLARPAVEHRLAAGRLEAEIRPQPQLGGCRHHMLAFLVAEDGVGEVAGLLEEQVAQTAPRRARGSGKAGRPGADDGNVEPLFQDAGPALAQRRSV